jgi:hypothetical protein
VETIDFLFMTCAWALFGSRFQAAARSLNRKKQISLGWENFKKMPPTYVFLMIESYFS